MRFMILSFAFLFSSGIFSQSDDISYEKALVNFEDYKNLMLEVESVRANRLISLDQFNSFAEKENTIILDTRSFEKYTEKHVKGAINLPFTEFTQDNLERLIPDKNTRILIYCNNNFDGDQIAFTSKMVVFPSKEGKDTRLMLALNIPTYINLYGYGYKNIYELDELVNVYDDRISFEGTSSKPRYIIKGEAFSQQVIKHPSLNQKN